MNNAVGVVEVVEIVVGCGCDDGSYGIDTGVSNGSWREAHMGPGVVEVGGVVDLLGDDDGRTVAIGSCQAVAERYICIDTHALIQTIQKQSCDDWFIGF